MTEKKKDYVSPQTEVMKVQPMQMLCGSSTEPDGTKSMYEEVLNTSFFEES